MSQRDKTNTNEPHDEPPLDLDCSTDTLTPDQRSQTRNEPWAPEVTDNTMLSAASLSGEHDITGMLFDESELLGTSSQKESQGESEDSASSEQDSTLEAEGENASPRAKTKTNLREAKKKIAQKGPKKHLAPQGPASPKGAKKSSRTKATAKTKKGRMLRKQKTHQHNQAESPETSHD